MVQRVAACVGDVKHTRWPADAVNMNCRARYEMVKDVYRYMRGAQVGRSSGSGSGSGPCYGRIGEEAVLEIVVDEDTDEDRESFWKRLSATRSVGNGNWSKAGDVDRTIQDLVLLPPLFTI